MKKSVLTISLLCIALGGAACGNFRVEKPQRFAQLESGVAPGYNRVNTEVFSKKCYDCHSAARGNLGGVNLESYANAVVWRDQLQQAVVVENRMPPGVGLPADQVELVRLWLSAGTPENDVALPEGSAPIPPPPAKPTEPAGPANPDPVFFADVQARIFGSQDLPPEQKSGRCIQCHGTGSPLVNLDSYAKVIEKIARIQDRALVKKTMPPRTPLSENDQALLQAWIDQGARP